MNPEQIGAAVALLGMAVTVGTIVWRTRAIVAKIEVTEAKLTTVINGQVDRSAECRKRVESRLKDHSTVIQTTLLEVESVKGRVKALEGE
jgi:hypothetical protein